MGAKINVKVQPFDRKLELESNGEFQLSWQGWIGDYNDPMTFLDLWLSDASFNTQKYDNPRYDELITQAQEESDAAARLEMLRGREAPGRGRRRLRADVLRRRGQAPEADHHELRGAPVRRRHRHKPVGFKASGTAGSGLSVNAMWRPYPVGAASRCSGRMKIGARKGVARC